MHVRLIPRDLDWQKCWSVRDLYMREYWVMAQVPQLYKYVVCSITVQLLMIELTHPQGSAEEKHS